MRKGIIEEVSFKFIILGEKHNYDCWIFYNRRFEYLSFLDTMDNAGYGHAFYCYDLVRNLKPKVIVTLGAKDGHSFFSFCQAVKDGWLDTELSAVDTWVNDQHSGFYGESFWETFNKIKEAFYDSLHIKLVRKTFDQAVDDYEDSSIDILHINGCHTYESAKHQYERWVDKVKADGIILFNDITVKDNNFSVYKLWDKLKEKFDTLEFYHSHGLGVLCNAVKKYKNWFDSHQILKDHYPLMMENRILSISLCQKDEEISNLKLKIQQNAQEAIQQEQQLRLAHLEIALIKNSLSMRITAPLRTFKRHFLQVSLWVKQMMVKMRRGVVKKKHTMIRGQYLNNIKEAKFAGGSIGVHLHLYYIDLLNDITVFLENIPFKYDLYVSITDKSHKDNIRNKLTAIKTVKSCTIKLVPNQGRIWLPL